MREPHPKPRRGPAPLTVTLLVCLVALFSGCHSPVSDGLAALVLDEDEVPEGFVLWDLAAENDPEAGALFGLFQSNPGPVQRWPFGVVNNSLVEGWGAVYLFEHDRIPAPVLASTALRFTTGDAMTAWADGFFLCADSNDPVFRGERWIAFVWGFVDIDEGGTEEGPDPFEQAYLAEAGDALRAKTGGERYCAPRAAS